MGKIKQVMKTKKPKHPWGWKVRLSKLTDYDDPSVYHCDECHTVGDEPIWWFEGFPACYQLFHADCVTKHIAARNGGIGEVPGFEKPVFSV